ncbi:MAG TPA: hypothetical protein VFF27_08565 [Bacteroidia bacterium]|jgi:hypothetical protein|nr:hypothetical protein [Bacteroidia bacterium]
MKTKKIIADDNRPKIKIQLDYKTTIIVRTENALESWLSKFPEAKVIS